MPVRSVNFIQSPPPSKKGKSSIEKSPEWIDAMLKLSSGLFPGEYLTIDLPSGFAKCYGLKSKVDTNGVKTFLRRIQDKISSLKLSYDAYSVDNVIYVIGRSGVNR